MKTNLVKLIVVTTIATLFTACGTTGKRRLPPTANSAPTASQVRQVTAEPVEFVEVLKDSSGTVVTNRLTRHLITNLPQKRSPKDSSGFTPQDDVSTAMHREYDLLWTALEINKNLAVLKEKYNASEDEIKALKKRLAPVLSGEATGTPTAAPQLGLGVVTPASAPGDAELRRQFEELRFQQWKAEQYRKKGFK